MASSSYQIQYLKKHEWRLLKKLRLDALLSDPESFWDASEDTKQFKDDYWIDLSIELTKKGGSKMFLLKKSEEIIGFVYGIRQNAIEFSIGGLWVKPGSRKQGLARVLVEEVVKWVLTQTSTPVLKLWSPLGHTVNFYERLGFTNLDTKRKNPNDGRVIIEMGYKEFME